MKLGKLSCHKKERDQGVGNLGTGSQKLLKFISWAELCPATHIYMIIIHVWLTTGACPRFPCVQICMYSSLPERSNAALFEKKGVGIGFQHPLFF
jgi:hypothetical protein